MSSHPPVAEPEGFSFDGQAEGFDRRAGLPVAAARQIAAAVEELARGDLLLDIGAGTGEIGLYLTGGRQSYVGLDLSGSMLAMYQRKLGDTTGRWLAQADADREWPIAGMSVGTFFLSRAAHLLRPEHLVSEAMRVADPNGAMLIIGRVQRDRSSVRTGMRRQLHRLLARQGIKGRGGERAGQRLARTFEEQGATVSPPRQAAAWPVAERAADSLAAWRDKPGLAGRKISRPMHRQVLQELEHWAHQRYGDLETAHQAIEHYQLTAIHLPSDGKHVL